MRYTLPSLTHYLGNEFCELFLEYKGHKIMITSFKLEHYEVCVDDDTAQFNDIESLLDHRIDGKTLRAILPLVDVDVT